MISYRAPLREFSFVLQELLDIGRFRDIAVFAASTPETVGAILEEAARFCEHVLLPGNRRGDQEHCHFENGTVRTPQGFVSAYKAFAKGGWTSLACDPAFGGQGQPESLNFALAEMACSTNVAFFSYPALSHAAYALLEAHGSNFIKQTFLPRLVDGRWSGTMCLTEAHCGTDLGLIQTKARPGADGEYRISGTKAFVSAGEHDLTENILHLVLARMIDAPPGTKGLSLFLIPRLLVKFDGSLGSGNGVMCGSVARKMGLNASATCTLHFDDARGYLIGKPGRGLHIMLTMMNIARLTVGVQGLGLAETAYQSARAYARERLQGRAIAGARNPSLAADPIIVHPDVRRMLLTMKAYTEGARGLAYSAGLHLDLSRHHPNPEVRAEGEDLVQLMTPVVKAFLTDAGFHAANLGLQIFGGHGYLCEHGMEQLVRDARIGQLYEGTNGIQALDLVNRKIVTGSGRLARRFFHAIGRFIDENRGDEQMREFTLPVAEGLARLERVTAWMLDRDARAPHDAAAAATDYLRLFALVSVADIWAKSAKIAKAALRSTSEKQFYEGKLATARFYMRHLLPQTLSLARTIMAGGSAVMALDAASF